MTQRLPPLYALRAFEAVARHLSFRKAAEELYVTPAAISHQIKTLEDYLGFHLFRRTKNALALTEAAQAGLPQVREGFERLAKATRQMREHHRSSDLTVLTAPSFAAKWLVPRLHRFAERHPEINLRILASINAVDRVIVSELSTDEFFNQDVVDVQIRFGQTPHTGCQQDKLFSVAMVPLCSPSLLQGSHPLRSPPDLRHHTLLHDEIAYEEGRPGWAGWLRAAGIEAIDPERGSYFSHTLLALEAAVAGQGVVLALRLLAEAELAAGRLVIPFGPELVLPQAYYLLICPQGMAQQPRIAAFREWLLEEVTGTGKRAGGPAGARRATARLSKTQAQCGQDR